MTTYQCFYDLKSIDITAKTKQEAADKAALLFGLGRRSWLITTTIKR